MRRKHRALRIRNLAGTLLARGGTLRQRETLTRRAASLATLQIRATLKTGVAADRNFRPFV
jgi:hypothetical protein